MSKFMQPFWTKASINYLSELKINMQKDREIKWELDDKKEWRTNWKLSLQNAIRNFP